MAPVGHDNFVSTRQNILRPANLLTPDIPIPHQHNPLIRDFHHPMQHKSPAINPCQHHIPLSHRSRPRQNNTFPPSENKRQHAPSFHQQSDSHPLSDETNGIPDNLLITHLLHDAVPFTVSAQRRAAAASGRHRRCHTGTRAASAFSVACKPSAMARSHRLPEMLGTSAA